MAIPNENVRVSGDDFLYIECLLRQETLSRDSWYMSTQIQLSIFLHLVVTNLLMQKLGERFQKTSTPFSKRTSRSCVTFQLLG